MTGPTCATACGRPTRDTLRLCRTCQWGLECDLGDVSWLSHELETTLARQAVVGPAANGSRSAETPLPIHTGALEARSQLRAALIGWTLDLLDTHGGRWPADTETAISQWLLARVDTLTLHQAAGEIHDEITSAVTQARRVVDQPANRTTFPVGPCPEDGCLGEVRAYIPAQPERAARLACNVCAAAWATHQWSRAGKRILARKGAAPTALLNSAVAAVLLGVSDRTVRRWVDRGRLVNHGDNRHMLVDLAEAERVNDAA